MRINPTFKKISVNSLIYSVGSQAPKLLSLISLPIITKYLDDTDFGVRGVLMSYMALLLGIKELGLPVKFQEAFFKREFNWKILWRFYHGILLLWYPLFVTLMAVIIYIFIPNEAQEHSFVLILLVCLPSFLLSSTNNLGRKYLIFSERPWRITLVNSLQTVMVISTNLLTIAYWKMGFLGWFVGDMVGTLTLFVFVLPLVYGRLELYPIFTMRLTWIKSVLKESLHLIPHNYSSFLYTNSDKIVLDQMGVDMGAIGHYNLAGNFSRYFKPLANGYNKSVRPTFFKLLKSKNEKEEFEAHEITVFMQKLFLLICFIGALWIKEVMDLLVSRPYVDQAYPFAVMLLMSYVQRPLFTLVSIKLISSGEAKHLWKVSLLPGLLNLFLNLVFIPFYGVIVAPLSTFLAMVVQGVIGFYLASYRKVRIRTRRWALWVPIFVIALILALFTMDSHWLFKAALTFICLIYGGFLFYKNQSRIFSFDP